MRTNNLSTWEVEKEEQKSNVISRYLESSRLAWTKDSFKKEKNEKRMRPGAEERRRKNVGKEGLKGNPSNSFNKHLKLNSKLLLRCPHQSVVWSYLFVTSLSLSALQLLSSPPASLDLGIAVPSAQCPISPNVHIQCLSFHSGLHAELLGETFLDLSDVTLHGLRFHWLCSSTAN